MRLGSLHGSIPGTHYRQGEQFFLGPGRTTSTSMSGMDELEREVVRAPWWSLTRSNGHTTAFAPSASHAT